MIHLQDRSRYIWYKFFSFSHSHISLGMMDRPGTSTNPLFIGKDDDMNSYVTKSHLFGAQCALHQEQQAMSNAQEIASTTSKRTMQEWTRSMLCCSTSLLPLLPHQDGAAQVDTPTTPSPAQVHRHQILFVVPCAKTVKQITILYTTSIIRATSSARTSTSSKSSYLCASTRKTMSTPT